MADLRTDIVSQVGVNLQSMSDLPPGARHEAFVAALSDGDEASAQFRVASAGLLVLRLVDALLEENDPAELLRDGWSVPAVRAAVDEVDAAQHRQVLHSTLDAIESSGGAFLAIGPRLMAYAQLLEYDARWELATAVYRAVVAHTHPLQDAEMASQAHLRIGFCLRQVGMLSDSVLAYQRASSIASRVGDIVGVLRARIGEAKAAIVRNQLPEAATILEDTIDRARTAGATAVQSMATHDRSWVAHVQGDYELAVRLAYEALQCSDSARERDRILGDLAGSFRKLGVRSAAHDAYVILSATAQEAYGRWAATLNLMEMAAEDGHQVAFETGRRTLNPSLLPVALQVDYWRIAALAARRWESDAVARSFLTRAIAIAEENELRTAAAEARQAVLLIEQGRPSWCEAPDPVTPHGIVEEVADRLRQARLAVAEGLPS